MKIQNNIFLHLIVVALFIVFTNSCKSEKKTIITIKVKDNIGFVLPDRKVYEFEYPTTHQLGNNPILANKFRLSDKSGKAVFVLDEYEYDKTKEINTLYFTVFNENSGNTHTIAGSVKVDFRIGESSTANLIIDGNE
jgi:hypothetical protein